MWARSGHTDYGRDGSRVPLPWVSDVPGFGFTIGTPWLPQPDWFADFTASSQDAAPGSVLNLYRDALRVRREIDQDSGLAWLDTGRSDVLAFERGDLVCVTVFDGAPYDVPADWGDPVLASDPTAAPTALPAGTTGWFRRA